MKLELSFSVNKILVYGGIVMERIYHPVSGQNGYFCTEKEKDLIDAVLTDFAINQLVVTTSANSRGGEYE